MFMQKIIILLMKIHNLWWDELSAQVQYKEAKIQCTNYQSGKQNKILTEICCLVYTRNKGMKVNIP